MKKQASLVKMNGIGNKILVIDMRQLDCYFDKEAVGVRAADKDTDFDQIMVIYPPRTVQTDAFIDIWNRDGTKAQACGNGMRCVVAYLAGEQPDRQFHFQTESRFIKAASLGAGRARIDMGAPRFDWRDIPTTRPLEDTLYVAFHMHPLREGTLVSIGNPHCVFFVDQDVNEIALDHYGSILEHDTLFADRANISLARLTSSTQMQLRTWERGAGLTLACGSAACAAVVAAVRRGLSMRRVMVNLPGGDLQIEWDEKTGHVLMEGDTQREFSGIIDPANGQFIKK